MKTVDSEALKRRLEVARNGDREQQKMFLSSINYHENCIVINEMNDSDLQWITPLALELFTPAVDVLVSGMTNKYRHWEEDFLDEDTGETVTVLRSESIDGETVFTCDDAIIDQIGKNTLASIDSLNNDELKDLWFWCRSAEVLNAIDEELYRRGDPDTICHRGDLYQYGDEEHGIFIDYNKAKTYYDRIGEEFDPVEVARKNRNDAVNVEYPDFATYHIQGDDVPAVKILLMELYEKYGEHSEPFMYLPLEMVMKALVGSDAYVGYIQSIDDREPCTFEVEFYGARIDCLKYALLQAFHNLEVEVTEHD